MHITYTLDVDDWVAYTAHRSIWWRRKHPVLYVLMSMFITVVPIIPILAAASFLVYGIAWWAIHTSPPDMDIRPLENVPMAAVGFLFAAEVAAFAFVISTGMLEKSATKADRRFAEWQVRFLVKRGAINMGWRYELEMTATGLTQWGKLKKSERGDALEAQYERRLGWTEVEAIDATDRQAFFVAKGKLGWVVVPRSAFPVRPAFQEFIAKARRLWAGDVMASAITAEPLLTLNLELPGKEESIGAVNLPRAAEEHITREETSPPPVRELLPHRGALIQGLAMAVLVSGLVNVVCPCVPLYLVALPCCVVVYTMARGDLAKMRDGRMDPGGYEETSQGLHWAKLGLLVSAVVLVLSVAAMVIFGYSWR